KYLFFSSRRRHTRSIRDLSSDVCSSDLSSYLVDGPNVLVQKMTSPISCEITPAVLGAMAKDGGGLIVEAQDVQEALDDPIAAKYLRTYVGSRELARGLSRWSL